MLITSSGSTFYMPVRLRVYGGVQLKPDTFFFLFHAEPGKPPPPPQATVITPECLYSGCPAAFPVSIPWTSAVKTNSGGNWLSAASRAGELSVGVNSASLPAGVYTDAVTLTSPSAGGPTQVPVVLVVRSGPYPALTASPSNLNVRVPLSASSGDQIVCIRAGESQVRFDASASTTGGGDWLGVSHLELNIFGCMNILFKTHKLAAGTYTGKVAVTAVGQSPGIRIQLTVDPPSQPPPPMLGSMASAASALPGTVAPDEIVTIRGMGLGPDLLAFSPAPILDPPRVFFDGIPAPVLFASAAQINATVPDQPAVKAATLEVRHGYYSASWGVPLAAAAPGIFTLNSSGRGQAAVLNQDNTLNGISGPAPRGSVIQIFATGFGPWKAADSDDLRPVGVAIGESYAQVTFAGPAPKAWRVCSR